MQSRKNAFTLIETLLGLVIFVLLLTSTFPIWKSLNQQNHLRSNSIRYLEILSRISTAELEKLATGTTITTPDNFLISAELLISSPSADSANENNNTDRILLVSLKNSDQAELMSLIRSVKTVENKE